MNEDAEIDALFWDRCDILAEAMEALPAISAADFAAKAVTATARGSVSVDWNTDPLWQEARRLVA